MAVAFTAQAVAFYSPQAYFEGDCPYYISTALSILHDGDIDLRNQLRGGLEVHGRQIALGRGGQWYPKHPLLMPLAALPFLVVFGLPGFTVLSVALLAALGVVLMRLARTVAPPAAAAGAALLLMSGSFLRRYDYNITPDVLAALVAALGLLALWRGGDVRGGLFLGMAAAAKLANLFLLPFGLVYALACRGRRGLLRCAASAMLPASALLMVNLALFGSPFLSSYDRNVVLQDGALAVVSHRGHFDRNVLSGLAGELFDREHGLIPTSPALWLALPGFALMYRCRRREAILALLLGEFFLFLFATYRYWATTRFGNRFLILLVVLAAPPVALALEWTGGWLKERIGLARMAPSGAPARAGLAPARRQSGS